MTQTNGTVIKKFLTLRELSSRFVSLRICVEKITLGGFWQTKKSTYLSKKK